MRAVVMQGGHITVEDIDEPRPGPEQVLIAPHYTGICGSDLHVRDALRGLADSSPETPPAGLVPGHEFAGEVVGLGSATDLGADSSLQVGDLVTAIPFTNGATRPETIGLSPEHSGGLAEFVVADAVRTIRLPDGIDARLGALTEPLAVAVRAYNRGVGSGPLVVVGAGPIGLGIMAVAAAAGRHPIIAIEPSPERRAAARHAGADEAHEPGTPLSVLLDEAGHQPATISPLLAEEPTIATVFECVGRPEVIESILVEAPPHSHVVLAGACHEPVELKPLPLTTAEVTVTTSFAYRPADFATALGLLRQQPERFAKFITSERGFDDAADAFDDLGRDPSEIKILIRPPKQSDARQEP